MSRLENASIPNGLIGVGINPPDIPVTSLRPTTGRTYNLEMVLLILKTGILIAPTTISRRTARNPSLPSISHAEAENLNTETRLATTRTTRLRRFATQAFCKLTNTPTLTKISEMVIFIYNFYHNIRLQLWLSLLLLRMRY
jgi:hypothetical protein